jgi:hypothetical protein
MIEQVAMIDFSKIEGPVYTGRDRGEQLRVALQLDRLDNEKRVVEVSVPSDTYTITSSFFLGLFGPSVVSAGSKEAFYARYHFRLPPFLKEVVDVYISRALQKRLQLG